MEAFHPRSMATGVMVEAAEAVLVAAGLDRARIHADAFYTEADKAALTKGGAA